MPNSNRQGERLERFVERLFDFCIFFIKVLRIGFSTFKYWRLTTYIKWAYVLMFLHISFYRRVLFKVIGYFYPNLLGADIYEKMLGQSVFWYFTASVIIIVFGYFFMIGFFKMCILLKHQRKLDLINLKSGKDRKPLIKKVKRIDKFRSVLAVFSEGVGIEHYRKRAIDLEASFGKYVDKIVNGSDPRFIEIHLTTKKIPTKCNYSDYENYNLPKYSFIVGETQHGLIIKKITDLPHLLVAGTTGGGKSIFFKQALLGLLKSSPYLQMYLLDLKGGLEMKIFRSFPNVQVEKDMISSLQTLRVIELEMNRRFNYLENKGFKEIIPERDKMDRIVAGVDEASMLYGSVRRGHGDYNSILEARELTDKIAKLGRAAGIHLILATQKITKETIGTSIQENVTGRMCFRMNTLQGSLVVLGNKMAMELPETPGRAIWQSGNQRYEAQAPFITDEDIEEYSSYVNSEYEQGKKRSFKELLKNSTMTKKTLIKGYRENKAKAV